MASNMYANELPTYLENDHILFQHCNHLFLNSKNYVESQLNVNDIDNSLVLICAQEWQSHLYITQNDLRDATIYVNLNKLGLVQGGYVRASHIKSVIDDHLSHIGEPRMYILNVDVDTPVAPSVVSWSYYKELDDDAVSSSHCQPGRNGVIYNISISPYTILPVNAKGNPKNKKTKKPKLYKTTKNGKKPKLYKKTKNGKKQAKPITRKYKHKYKMATYH